MFCEPHKRIDRMYGVPSDEEMTWYVWQGTQVGPCSTLCLALEVEVDGKHVHDAP